MSAVTTRIRGHMYKPDGTKITTGKIIVSLTYDFISIDGYKIAPFLKVCTLDETTGLIDFYLAATVNDLEGSIYGQPYPLGVSYQFEFDPNPSDATTPIYRKDGYWKALYTIPHISDDAYDNEVSFGALVQALSSEVTTSASFIPITDPRMLTQFQRDLLTHGEIADVLHTHTPLNNNLITLFAITDPGTPEENECYLFLTSVGTTPNCVITLWGRMEDNSTFIVGSTIV